MLLQFANYCEIQFRLQILMILRCDMNSHIHKESERDRARYGVATFDSTTEPRVCVISE